MTVEGQLQLESFDGRRLVLESVRNVTESKAWAERQDMLLRELNHRVRNTLTVVQAIAHQTRRTSNSLGDFVERFDGRLAALASAHNLLMQSEWKGADLATLARDHVMPYSSDVPNRFRLEGEPLVLPAELATPFGLVLHELATNAAKHGSLSNPDGGIELRWRIIASDGTRDLELTWREWGGFVTGPPGRPGFGSTLIEVAIPNANVERKFLENGLICTIRVSLPPARQKEVEAKQR